MSHLAERSEKNCLNCGAETQGRFCHVCGQENIEPKESFWHLLTHFVYDVTHFDGKFFSTLKYLLFKPGYLSHEYLKGRRASYLHPIRMYVFTSAIFFLIFFSLNKEEDIIKVNENKQTATEVLKQLETNKKKLEESLNSNMPDVAKSLIKESLKQTEGDIVQFKKDTNSVKLLKTLTKGSDFNVINLDMKDSVYATVASYDSAQSKLPEKQRDGFFKRKLQHQNLHIKERYHGDKKAVLEAIFEKFKHLFPQMLFISLPLFALMLQLIYVRRKQYFYVNHVVFTIHLYCGTFILILAGILLSALLDSFGVHFKMLNAFFVLITLFYWYKSFRNFYLQRRGKTILKYFIILFLSLLMMIFLFGFFMIFSVMAI